MTLRLISTRQVCNVDLFSMCVTPKCYMVTVSILQRWTTDSIYWYEWSYRLLSAPVAVNCHYNTSSCQDSCHMYFGFRFLYVTVT